MILSLLALSACTDGGDTLKPPGETDTSEPTDDTYTIPPVEDCVSNVTMTPSDVRPNVFVVEWDTLSAGTSLVEWGPTGAYGRTTTPSEGTRTSHKVVVVGAKGGETTHFRVVSEVDGTTCGSDDQTFEAPPLPSDLPRYQLGEVIDGGFTSGFRSISMFGLLFGVEILDDDAEPIWWEGFEGEGSSVYPIQTHLLAGTTEITYMLNDATRRDDICEIVHERLDGVELNRARCELGHHDFAVLPDGRYAFLYADFRDTNDYPLPVVGDAIHIIDPDGGNLVEIWNAWDEFRVPNDLGTDPFYPNAYDWTHANSLTYDPASDSLLLSLHNLNSVLSVALDGTTNWRLGEGGDFTLSAQEQFHDQHAAKFVSGSTTDIVLFDNGDITDMNEHSEASRFRLDFSNMTAERVWNEDHDTTYKSYILGDTWAVGDDNYLVSWGTKGEVGEYSAEGELVWRANTQLAATTGYINHHETLGGVIE